jgi:hypothetical protein
MVLVVIVKTLYVVFLALFVSVLLLVSFY